MVLSTFATMELPLGPRWLKGKGSQHISITLCSYLLDGQVMAG